MIEKRYRIKGNVVVNLNEVVADRELCAGNLITINFSDGAISINITEAIPITSDGVIIVKEGRPLRRLDIDRCETDIG